MAREGAEIKSIVGSSQLTNTFTLRRETLFNHTQDFCAFADAEAAVFVFSNAGNAFAFGHPAIEAVVGPYLVEQPSASGKVREQSGVADADAIWKEEAADSSLTAAERRLSEAFATGRPAWDVATKDLRVDELDELEEAATEILTLVREQIEVIRAEFLETGELKEHDASD